MKKLVPLTIIFIMLAVSTATAQNTLSTSKVWYASVLQKYFPSGIKIDDIRYPLHAMPCLPKDITKFNVIAEKIDIGIGPAFQVKGTVKLGAVPSPFTVIDGVYGKKYMLYLQAFLFSPNGKIVWEQTGFPKGGAWVNANGDMASFVLINAFRGSTRGCKLLVIAAGDPIFSDYDETRVILGMKRFSFQDNTVSTRYDPLVSKKLRTSTRPQKPKKPASAPKPKYTNLRYKEKLHDGWLYTEVEGIPVAERKKIFYKLVDYQNKTRDVVGAYKVIAKRYGIPEKAVRAILFEGMRKNWPMP